MPVVTKLGELQNDGSIIFRKVIVGDKVFVYLDYTQGTEDSVILEFEVVEERLQNSYLLRDDSFNPVRIVVTGNDKSVYPVPTPPSAEDLVVRVFYTNLQKTDTRSYPADGVQTTFTDILFTEVVGGSLTVAYTIGGVSYTATDDGAGNITGTNLTGTIDYTTGNLNLTFSVAPDAGTNVTVSYTYAKEGQVGLDVISKSPYS